MSGTGLPPREGATRVLIADDHAFEHLGLVHFITAQGPGWEICAVAREGEEAVARAIALRPEILILDSALPGLDPVEAAACLRERAPGVEVLILCDHHSRHLLVRIHRCRARGP